MRIQYLILPFCFLICSQLTFSADKDSNVVITESRELHEFIWKRGKSTVQVKQTISNSYYCNYFSTTLPISELYHDQISIDDISITVNNKKVKSIEPQHSYYESDGIFFSDQRICSFNLPFGEKGSSGIVSIKRTISDPRYFCNISFFEAYPVTHKEVSVKVPRWMKVELKEMNFMDFKITKTAAYNKEEDADIYTYTVNNLPSISSEPNCPGISYTQPHILVLAKESNIHNKREVYINTVADQYAWYRRIIGSIGSDLSVVKEKALQLTAGITNDLDKIKTIFYWVQNNIRYVAFEHGIAGFRPDKADEVIRKKYGDCKGMANLTKELLNSLGYDARLCWIGTNNIAYDYSTPSLAVDNHMICALNWQDKMYFLDATETYLALNEYAERIQGRQCLVEDGDKYILTNIPASTYEQNLDEEKRTLSIDGTDLKGTATRQWKGEEKEDILTNLNSLKKNKSAEAFITYLSGKNPDYMISDFKTSDVNNFDQHLTASYRLNYKNAVSSFSGDLYVSLDFGKDYYNGTIDPLQRNFDYWFDNKMRMIRETELIIPPGYSVKSILPNLEIENDIYKFSVNCTVLINKIMYRKTLVIKDMKLTRNKFAQWNKDIERLTASYNEQIVLTAK